MNNNLIKHHEHHATIDIDAATRGLLLRMGDDWLELGELFQAIDTYLKINEEYPGSEESDIAQSRLMTISRGYEKDGLLRLSLDVLERLEQTIPITV